MRFEWVFIVVASMLCVSAHAQIYTCRAADGTRIFSDERCGPDAKVVPGIESRSRPAAKSGPATKQVAVPRSTAELDQLLQQCDKGHVPSCNAWTRGGGPGHLKEQERQTQLACEGGLLSACEERYCSDGAGPQCRARVLQTAKLAGETWYLREEGKRQTDDSMRYNVRCIWDGVRSTRDVAVTCAAKAGPQRCSDGKQPEAFERLDAAASSYCSRL